ncbi:MAG TPA: hypothetical protein VE999_20810 [Gemmataceae bacterium]|nr:hypothetical protein [Gemmataceae bacterium]
MNLQCFQRSFHVLLLAAALVLPATAQAQSELLTRYKLEIVVHVAENRTLTDVFRGRVERELRDGFQAALGDMGHVTVTHEHPRLAEVLARGLRSLDDWKDRDDKKTHFVLIDYSGVHYEIQARQYDGTIGRASPVVRRDRTRDRDFVAKAAALLIKHDFGVVGTVQSESEGASKQVKIELRGGGLGDMSRWVKKDDVFALAPPDGGSSLLLRWSLLQVERAPDEAARDGVCECRFFHRYRITGGIVGYRCIKLGTVRAPLRIRWVQGGTKGRGKPLNQQISVDIRRYGFEGEEKLPKESNLDGVMETVRDKNGVFDNVAFVRVTFGLGDSKPQIPIALCDDQPISIEVDPPKDSDSLFAYQKTQWQAEVAESVRMQANLFKRLEALGANPEKRAEIIQLAKSGLSHIQADRTKLEGQRGELAKRNKRDLKTPIEDERLKQLGDYEQALRDFIAKQEEIEKTENDPQLKRWRSEIASAKLIENDLEFGKAIEIYERIQNEGYKNADLEKHLADLHKIWDTSDNDLKDARGFIYGVWPSLDITRLEEKIPEAKKAFKKCQDARDYIPIKKLLLGTLRHADQLKKKLDELQPDLVTDDAKEYEQFSKIGKQIADLGDELQNSLKKADVK